MGCPESTRTPTLPRSEETRPPNSLFRIAVNQSSCCMVRCQFLKEHLTVLPQACHQRRDVTIRPPTSTLPGFGLRPPSKHPQPEQRGQRECLQKATSRCGRKHTTPRRPEGSALRTSAPLA